ncbi:MAG: T9SS type A sorting domain-containing protein [Bacteroidetes bacterium]|nr:T9SS type A sorting domain-containing protein [Bacteroidota bacterium]
MSLKLFLLAFFICISVTNYGQATHVQTHWTWNSTASGSGTSSSLSHTNTFGSTSTTGNLIVVHVSYSGQVKNVSTVTDSKSNSYTKINGPTNWGGVNYYRSELWYAYNISGGSNITITVTMSGSTPMTTSADGLQFIQIFASEFSGIGTSDPLDQSSVAITSTRPFNSGSAIINYSNELVYGAAIGGTMPAITRGSSFTSLSNQNNNRVEYKNVSSAGTYNADFSSSGNGTAVADMATFITSGSVLPIKLLNFYASENSGAIDLRWQTTTEINNDYFEVLRSLDGMNWSVIAKIKGAGNSVGIKSYLFSDVSPTMGLNYYRLKQVDFDGNSTLSFVVDAQNSDAHSHAITIVPNPVEDWLTIRNNLSDDQSVHVFNMLGENVTYLISEQTKTNFGFSLNLNLLPEGFYIVKAGQFSEKILKK